MGYCLIRLDTFRRGEISQTLPIRMAEREGFEPSVPVRVHSISNAAP